MTPIEWKPKVAEVALAMKLSRSRQEGWDSWCIHYAYGDHGELGFFEPRDRNANGDPLLRISLDPKFELTRNVNLSLHWRDDEGGKPNTDMRVSLSKPAGRIVAEIQRRIVPEYERYLRKLLQVRSEQIMQKAATDSIWKAIKDMLSPGSYDERVDSGGEIKTIYLGKYNDPISAKFRIGYGDTVEIEAALPLAEGCAVVAMLNGLHAMHKKANPEEGAGDD